MDLDQETAKELVKSVIDGFEEESIVNAESVTLSFFVQGMSAVLNKNEYSS